MEVWIAIALALGYSITNGFHDAANAIATLVATRGARPGQAIVLAGVFNMIGSLVIGTAVASTIAGIVSIDGRAAVGVIGAGLAGAVAWSLATWLLGLPSSSGHALVGGLVGAALVDAGPDAVGWGGLDGWRPTGLVGVLVALAVSPVVGFALGFLLTRVLARALRRATRHVGGPIRGAEWAMSAMLSLSHGANDAQKAMGVIAAVLLADGRSTALEVPLWAKLACGAALTVGTAFGGWRIVRTIGRGIVRLRQVDGLASQTGSTAVILAASAIGAPVSTTQVVASSVVDVGGGRGRWRHVRWSVVRAMGLAWVTTVPVCAGLGALALLAWRELA